jgi:FADH2 O2-dependent halogenase
MKEVIIIGGGPAGSAIGSFLSKAGIDNIILEGANHPRPHVGESMVTSSTRVFKELDFIPVLEREGFVHKYGASWHAPQNQGKFSIEFSEYPQQGVDQDYTYHVDRSKLDLLLLKHAESLGTKVHQGVHVSQILFDDDYATGVKVKVGNKQINLKGRMVVDASGRNTILGRQLKLKVKDPIFNQYAVHAWFDNVDRGTDSARDHIHIYFLPIERGWVWQIPITNETTSMGVVVERDAFRKAHLDLPMFFDEQVQTNKNLANAMRNANRVNEFKTEGDYSYSMSRFTGDGFVLIGDAARFVDPIFSSGVSIALYTAKYASEQIRKAFDTGDFSHSMFLPYEHKVRAGVNIWYEFIRLYYKLLPLFTYFISSKQHRLQVLQLLQGEVYDRAEVPVLKAMRDFITMIENSDNHVFKQSLTSMPIDEIAEQLGEKSLI